MSRRATGVAVAFAIGYAGARATAAALRRRIAPPERAEPAQPAEAGPEPANPAAATWWRTNYRGRRVDLVGGPALVTGAVAAAVTGAPPDLAGAAAIGLAGLAGAYDDLRSAREHERAVKGFAGHLRALTSGRLTAGGVKLVGIGAAGMASAALQAGAALQARAAVQVEGRRRPIGRIVADGALVAGMANLVNLFDLRPGRALKAAALLALPALPARRSSYPGQGTTARLLAGVAGAACAVAGDDLRERTMLGDAGANALGAAVGIATVAGAPPRTRTVSLVLVVALTALSERVSFSAVIARTPWLRRVDEWGRAAEAESGAP